jgi:D-xylulose reductase
MGIEPDRCGARRGHQAQEPKGIVVRAVVLEKAREIRIEEVPEPPDPGPRELRISPQTVGICGSDVHYYLEGRIGRYAVREPMILGHEASGVVTGVGRDIRDFRVGDRVVMEPGIPDMSSRAARIGMYNVDPDVRFWATPPVDGCLVESLVHPAAFTYHLPDNVSFGEGAFVEPLAVAMHAVTKADIAPGDVVAVTGAGTIGLLTASVALAGGASTAIVSDISPVKLEMAAEIPGVVPVNVRDRDLVEAVLQHTGGWGADVVFEASGVGSVYSSLWRLGAPGNRTVLIGIPTENPRIDLTEAQARETRIETVFRYANVYQKAVNLLASGKLDVARFISHTYPLDDAAAAFDRVAESRPSDVKIQISVS